MEQWKTANALYGDSDHIKYMRDGYEPFAIIPVQSEISPITRQPALSFIVFLKKFEINDAEK
jgi:hypothetical protein